MSGPINSYGIAIGEINPDPFGFPAHMRHEKTANTRIGPPIPSIYTAGDDYIKKASTDEVRGGHFPLDITPEIDPHDGLPLQPTTMGELASSVSSYNCSSYPNSSQSYTSLPNCGLSAEPPMASEGYYHRDSHMGTSYPFPDYTKMSSSSLRIHPSSQSLPAQKPPSYSAIPSGIFNLSSNFPDSGPYNSYNYYQQTTEQKVSHPHYYRRPFPPALSSAFEPLPENSPFVAESQRFKDDPRFSVPHRPERVKQPNHGESREVEDVDDANRCKNTVEGTKTSVRRFKKWYKDKTGKSLDMNVINKNMAVELLKDFFLEIRDTRPGKEGNEYEPVTLTTYRNGLRRYFLERKCPPAVENFDLADREFDVVNYGLVTKRNELKRKGKGNHPNVVESITEAQLERMWASGAIGVHAPRPLLRLQWWINTVCHGIRGRMAHHDLSIDDFRISRGPDGKIVIDHVKAGSKRTRAGDDKESSRSKKRCKAKVAATDGGDRDPVRAFEVYLRHRPPGISSFYLTPKHKPKGDIWFNKVPMGKNSIGRIMREIKAIAGIG